MQLEIAVRAAKNNKDGNGYIIRKDRTSRPARRDRVTRQEGLYLSIVLFSFLFIWNIWYMMERITRGSTVRVS